MKDYTQGNIAIGKNIGDITPIIIPYEDRFSNTLILGQTGCGKTHHALLPMIEQDMQNPDCSITVIEPKGDLAFKAFAMAKYYKRNVLYFNPRFSNCPSFNPLFGDEESVLENLSEVFRLMNEDSPQFFIDMNDMLLRFSIKILKRIYGNKATLKTLDALIGNKKKAVRILSQFYHLDSTYEQINYENSIILNWFLNDYYGKGYKTYDVCSGLRAQIKQIVENPLLSTVLNPSDGATDIDFDKHLENNGVLVIDTAQGMLGNLGRFLSYFIIYQLQSAVFRRHKNYSPQRPNFVYMDEFQLYSNPWFVNLLTQVRPSQIALHLATQNRPLIGMGGGRRGREFTETISSMVRNIFLFPHLNPEDAIYYSKVFNDLSSYSITNRSFGEFTARIIKKNQPQPPVFGITVPIPDALNKELEKIIREECQNNIYVLD